MGGTQNGGSDPFSISRKTGGTLLPDVDFWNDGEDERGWDGRPDVGRGGWVGSNGSNVKPMANGSNANSMANGSDAKPMAPTESSDWDAFARGGHAHWADGVPPAMVYLPPPGWAGRGVGGG